MGLGKCAPWAWGGVPSIYGTHITQELPPEVKMFQTVTLICSTHRHAKRSQSLLPHGHGHTLLLGPRLPPRRVNLQVDLGVLPQCLQKVLGQRADALITGHLLQLVQVGDGVRAYQHLGRGMAKGRGF